MFTFLGLYLSKFLQRLRVSREELEKKQIVQVLLTMQVINGLQDKLEKFLYI